MPAEPTVKRAFAFFDGQNLFHAAREAFGYDLPDFDAGMLAEKVCQQRGWDLREVHFYTGLHDPAKNPFWHGYWLNKIRVMGSRGVRVIWRPLRYRTRTVDLPEGKVFSFSTAEEKGVDVRIAVDLIRLAQRKEYDVALVFSQDQDLMEATDEVKVIAQEQDRWIRLASAYPRRSQASQKDKNRGINKTDWIAIDQALYDACRDARDYRPKASGGGPT